MLLIERGLPDLHRDSCLDCRREHEARGQLVRAFQLVGGQGGDARWQARVWRRIAALEGRREERREDRRPWMPWVPWATALAAVGALTVGVVHRGSGVVAGDVRPRIDIVPSEVAMRSTSHGIGDRVRMWVGPTQEARVYRAEKLVLRCTPATSATPGCTRDDGGLVAEYRLELPGDYQLVIAPAGIAEPGGAMDPDLAAITAAGGTYQLHDVPVR